MKCLIKSSWREQDKLLLTSLPTEINFNDTLPNHIYIINLSVSAVYVGWNFCDSSNYDVLIPAGSSKLLCKETGNNKIYAFTSGASVTIKVKSFEKEFIATSLNTSQDLSSSAITSIGNITDASNIDEGTDGTLISFTKGLVNRVKAIITLIGSLAEGKNIDETTPGSVIAWLKGLIYNTKNPTTPTIYNIDCVLANTEYSQAIVNAKKICISCQGGTSLHSFRIAFVNGLVAAPTPPYIDVNGANEWSQNNIIFTGTIYVASSAAGKMLQMEVWT